MLILAGRFCDLGNCRSSIWKKRWGRLLHCCSHFYPFVQLRTDTMRGSLQAIWFQFMVLLFVHLTCFWLSCIAFCLILIGGCNDLIVFVLSCCDELQLSWKYRADWEYWMIVRFILRMYWVVNKTGKLRWYDNMSGLCTSAHTLGCKLDRINIDQSLICHIRNDLYQDRAILSLLLSSAYWKIICFSQKTYAWN